MDDIVTIGIVDPCRFRRVHLLYYSFSAPYIFTKTRPPKAQKENVACLIFSRLKKGIAKRPTENMMRRHATRD